MKVKAVDIARELGISAATVSLAMNNREGVSEATRAKVLECKKRLEEGTGSVLTAGSGFSGVIKNIVFLGGFNIIRASEIDLWTDVHMAMDQIAKSWGCSLETEYFNVLTDSPEKLAAKCNDQSVAGVIVSGTEMLPKNARLLKLIKKPLVVYDSDMGSDYSCSVFDNAEIVFQTVQELIKKRMKKIVYLAFSDEIYNFRKRREGFRSAMLEYNLFSEDCIVHMGRKIDEMKINIQRYLDINGVPDAFIAECYPLSIAALRVFNKMGIEMPKDVSFIGIDELPEYMTYDCKISTIRVPHVERLKMAMLQLKHEIKEPDPVNKTKIYVHCDLIKGSTVAEKE